METTAATAECVDLALVDGRLSLWPRAFEPAIATGLLEALRTVIAWQQETIQMFGTSRRVPRLVAWHGDPGAVYRYSGTVHVPSPWTSTLQSIRERVETLTQQRFNSVLLNRYRDGRDSMGWHADDEPELGPEPMIASVSLGARRRFRLRHRRSAQPSVELMLEHGSLLVMGGTLQHCWQHSLPRAAHAGGERINLTFRSILPRAAAVVSVAGRTS